MAEPEFKSKLSNSVFTHINWQLLAEYKLPLWVCNTGAGGSCQSCHDL